MKTSLTPDGMPTLTRALVAADVGAMEALLHDPGVGFQQTADDLRTLLHHHANVLGTLDSSGDLLSMAALPTYSLHGHKVWSWLSYVVTAPRAQRRGLATALVAALLTTLPPEHPVGLYASVQGAPVYAAAGFVDHGIAQLVSIEGGSARRSARPEPHLLSHTLLPAHECLDALSRLDRDVYGLDRAQILESWALGPARELGWAMVGADGEVAGYVLGRPIHPSGFWIGPLVSETAEAAEALLRAAMRRIPADAQAVHMLPMEAWEVPRGAPEARGHVEAFEALALVQRLGFSPLGAIARLMVRGGSSGGASSGGGASGGGSSGGVPPLWLKRNARAITKGTPRSFAAAGYEFG